MQLRLNVLLANKDYRTETYLHLLFSVVYGVCLLGLDNADLCGKQKYVSRLRAVHAQDLRLPRSCMHVFVRIAC